ncbi:hypothetical protein SteCoe_37385 [Stentor coeruleus]|uniref:RCC1-like domain-containing protein n=1 Tax=Stentor coeruleus TaxID=5963 RepID=A0A1R2AN65_9CILI|nr:hypothetical protein SteCoe_37385 [Stentor coeruleus]
MEKLSSAYAWGKNKDGELSVGTSKDVFLPHAVRGMKNKQIVYVASGGQHSACIDTEGQLYVCGSYLHGKLGIENLTTVSLVTFTLVKALQGKKVKQVACGDYHTLCLLEDGSVYTWGGTLHKKLGHRSNASRGSNRPGVVSNLQNKRIIYVDCGDFHSVALGSDGKLYTWGGGGASFNNGQCGHGHTNDLEEPTLVSGLKHKEIVQVSCGGYHTLALSRNNELFSFGRGLYGECGFGEFLNTSSPKLITFTWSKKSKEDAGEICQISAGGHHSLVLTTSGAVYSFGFASHGQLGLRSTTNYCEPQLITDIRHKGVKSIAAGWNHSLLLTSRGDVWACGYGFYGQLGLGDDESRTSFVHVSSLEDKNIQSIHAGDNHSWVIINLQDPIKENYTPPSPLPDDLSMSSISNISKIEPSIANPSFMPESEFEITIVYSDILYCHRFVSYTLKEASLEIGKARAEEYVHEMYVMENGLQCHRIQEDDQILEIKDNGSEELTCQGGKCLFTCALVFDPTKNIPALEVMKNEKFNDVTVTKQSFQLTVDDTETMLSEWARFFVAKVGNFCKQNPVFFELRPSGFCCST